MKFWLLLCTIIFILTSCRNAAINDDVDKEITLRTTAQKIESDTLWTHELESVRLSKNYANTFGVVRDYELTPDVLMVANTEAQSVYPILPGFGSLNNSGISSELKIFLDKICYAISHSDIDTVASLTDKNSLWSVIFFFNDVGLDTNIPQDIPTNDTNDTNNIDTQLTNQENNIGNNNQINNANNKPITNQIQNSNSNPVDNKNDALDTDQLNVTNGGEVANNSNSTRGNSNINNDVVKDKKIQNDNNTNEGENDAVKDNQIQNDSATNTGDNDAIKDNQDNISQDDSTSNTIIKFGKHYKNNTKNSGNNNSPDNKNAILNTNQISGTNNDKISNVNNDNLTRNKETNNNSDNSKIEQSTASDNNHDDRNDKYSNSDKDNLDSQQVNDTDNGDVANNISSANGNPAANQDQNDIVNTPKKEMPAVFSWYLYGEPFFTTDSNGGIQVPVRFYQKIGSDIKAPDVLLYIRIWDKDKDSNLSNDKSSENSENNKNSENSESGESGENNEVSENNKSDKNKSSTQKGVTQYLLENIELLGQSNDNNENN